jgi:hypothetical protein
MDSTAGWILFKVLAAAGALAGAIQFARLAYEWLSKKKSRLRWSAGVALILLALAGVVYLEYKLLPPAPPPITMSPGPGPGAETTTTKEEKAPPAPMPEPPTVTATETAARTSDAEDYLRATTGLEKGRVPEIDELLDPDQITELIKQTGRGATNWFVLADGPIRVFCISGTDNQVTSLLCERTPCDLNRLPFCHHVRIKNEDKKRPVRVRIWYYNPFGPR